MKTFFLDTNVLLRFILNDHEQHHRQSKEYLLKAKNGDINLVLLPAIVIEIEHVLRKVYRFSKDEFVTAFFPMLQAPYLRIPERELLLRAVRLFRSLSVDFVDAFLFASAEDEDAEVLSFDEDFRKFQRTSR